MFQKIKAIAAVNNEIVERLKQRKEVITDYSYNFTYSDYINSIPQFTLEENAHTETGEYYLKNFHVTVQLHTIEDIFNDKLDYNCKNFADLERLNRDMLKVSLKYELFGESEKSISCLKKFLDNFEQIQVGLGQLETVMFNKESKNDRLQKKVEKLNEILAELSTEIQLPQASIEPRRKKIKAMKKHKTKKKDLDAPRRNMNAYMFFCNANRDKVKTELGPVDAKIITIAKRLGELWKASSDKEKKPYEEMAAKDKERYEKDLAAYRKIKGDKEEYSSSSSEESESDDD
jgi:hypothetical protein